jgi:hypothetical protein
MPSKSGPWLLDRVKRRLRQEQVVREEAASERYKQQEEREKVQQNTNQDEQRLSLQERNVGGGHWAVILKGIIKNKLLVTHYKKLVAEELRAHITESRVMPAAMFHCSPKSINLVTSNLNFLSVGEWVARG